MRRACAIILFLVFTQCLIETIQANEAEGDTCGKHGTPCDTDSQCCPNTRCHRFAKRCQVQLDDLPKKI